MSEPPDKAPLKLPWEIGPLRIFGLLIIVLGAVLFAMSVIGSVIGILSVDDKFWGFEWSLIIFFGGIFLRAIAGMWGAMERLAAHEIDRRP